jgi:large repetitive protein
VKIIDPIGKETRFAYDVGGNLTKRTDADGKSVYYEYDNEGRLLKTVDGNGNEIAVGYEEAPGEGCTTCTGGTHQPSTITFPSIEEDLKYDVRGRKVLERFVYGTEDLETTYGYDDAGNITTVTDREGRVTRFGYDALNRLVLVTDASNGETRYAYDNRDNLLAITDAQGHTTRFEYDRNNRLVKEIRPMGQETAYGYDPAGNLIEKIDAKGQKAGYGYDDAGRLEQIQYFAAGDHVNAVKTVTFSYDLAGNLTGYDDGTTSAIYGYNDLHQRVSETVNYGPFALTNEYTFYNNGLKQTFTGPDNITYGYLYDGNNQFSGLQIPDVGLITVNAYNWFQPEQESLPGGATRQYTYDGLMRTSGIDTQDPGQNPVVQQTLGYDRMDNVVSRSTPQRV